MQNQIHPVRVGFGTFEADLSTGELWRGGFRIKLQSQPFRVMAELIRRSGHVVTREELQAAVWEKGTNVDFDHSLGTAINKIREALGDTADNPRFVETLPRRGYRFIAPLTVLDEPTPASPEPGEILPPVLPIEAEISGAVLTPGPVELTPPLPLLEETPSASAAKHRRFGYAVAATVILLAGLVGYVAGSGRTSLTVPVIRQVTHTQRVLPGADATESFPVTVTDGLHLFASVIRDGGVHLERITIAGGESSPITLPDEVAGPAIADISHDGSRLLVRSHASNQSEQPLFIVPAGGGSAQRVVRVLAHDATWMPDDQSILYAAGNDLFVTPMTGAKPERYASLPGRAFWLRWSPDGKLLRFTLFDPLTHTQNLWELKVSDHSAHPLLPNWSETREVCCGSWMPEGRGFVFQATQGQASDLWMLNGVLKRPVRLTDGPLAYQGPVAARNETTVYLTGVASEGEVQLLRPNSKEFVPAQSFYSDAHRLEQTRDGKWLGWVDTEGRLWRARSDGSEILQLTSADLQVFVAHWSPDGSRIALMARTRTGAWSLFQVLADGSDLQPLLQTRSNAADPTWSPDGQQIVLGQTPDLMGKDAAPRTIQIFDLRTNKLTTLDGSSGLFSPRWSPDGHHIAAMSLDQRELRLYDVATRQWRVLATRAAADPVWSPDSRSLYADAFTEPGQPVYRVNVADGHMEDLGGIANFRSTEFSDLVLCGVFDDGTVAVRGRLTTANLYALHLGASRSKP
ncbi:winged helix-turn-helix domain-containing protein [Terriglobus roseus]|uniref:DNA-binding winged helix-turn-helix (WHTH) domain-containing protein n=1 Tax=Terriglobus roseus TaxID=392734 RepID=A0A1H4NXW0_9BACT|nr:winged helix-turn-helix domain-containing protein [Terriglobus roseus]SEC00040.1 DNA-binding winged helix-turn-helix (wHTH) domain-containing protein [Terriglobus roseus]